MNDCIFCQIVTKKALAHIVYEDSDHLAFLDTFSQSRGHLQLIPKKHYRWVWEIPDMGAFFGVAQKIIRGIIPVLKADHVRLAAIGDEVRHAHLWIVPQYKANASIGQDKGQLAELLRSALR